MIFSDVQIYFMDRMGFIQFRSNNCMIPSRGPFESGRTGHSVRIMSNIAGSQSLQDFS